MSSPDRRLTSWTLSLFHGLEENTQTRVHVLVVACGTLATAGMWMVHLIYPYILHNLIQIESKFALLFLMGLVLAPPFAVAFSIGSLISPQANETVKEEAGPMSGYFYRERADRRWKIAIAAGIIAGINLVSMLATSS